MIFVLYSCGKDQQSSMISGVGEVSTPTPTNPPAQQNEIPIPKIETLRWYPKNVWQTSWSKAVVNKVSEMGLGHQEVEVDDLADLGCLGYSNSSERERAMFWLVLVASVASQESAFDPNNRYYERSLGEWSEGLMQLSVSDQSRGEVCRELTSSLILDPQTNLQCAVLILKDQLHGSRTRSANHIFPTRMYYWSTLTRESTKTEVIAFFKKHLDRLKFCSRS